MVNNNNNDSDAETVSSEAGGDNEQLVPGLGTKLSGRARIASMQLRVHSPVLQLTKEVREPTLVLPQHGLRLWIWAWQSGFFFFF